MPTIYIIFICISYIYILYLQLGRPVLLRPAVQLDLGVDPRQQLAVERLQAVDRALSYCQRWGKYI